MKNRANKNGFDKKRSYEPPRAMRVPVQMKKGLAGCLYTSPSLCEFTT